MTQIVNKKVELQLVGLNGNAFNLLDAFSSAAKYQGWSKEEIDAVCEEATSGDYNHLLETLVDHCDDPYDDDEDYDDEDDWEDDEF